MISGSRDAIDSKENVLYKKLGSILGFALLLSPAGCD